MHDNPRATDEEQELAQTKRMEEEEAQRSALAPASDPDADDEAEDEAEDDP